jgi:hypothetical protein
MKYAMVGIALLLMAVPVWLSGAPWLLVALLVLGVAIFVAAPMFLVARLSRGKDSQ